MQVLTNPVYGEDYKEGYVFFSYTTTSPISAGIALFQACENVTGESISHCGMISGPGKCIEATSPVLCESNFEERYLNHPNIVVFLRKPMHWSPAVAKTMLLEGRTHLGEGYSYTGVVGSALYVMLTFGYRFLPFLRYWKNPLNRDDEMFCSEYMAGLMRLSEGKAGCLKYHPSNIYPVTLFQDEVIWKPWNSKIVIEKVKQGKQVIDQ